VRLFDAIARQRSYDEAAIARQFAGEHWVKNLAVMKNYLTNAILRTLKVYHSNIKSEPDYQIKELLEEAALCFEKNL